ncbi:cytochrome b/b6 domain-containing protein [bacterium]|nr:cytochrome b/b6 domain-containing protein [bacterium]
MSRLWYQLRFYLWGILRGESHPFHPQKNSKFNPLQKLFYCLLMFLFFPVLLISGLLLVFPGYIPLEVFGQPGKWLIVLFHFISAGLFSVFLMVHLYLLTTGDRLSFLIRSMITGYHRSLKSGDQ